MKILVTALYVNGLVSEGGSSLFMKCLIDNLRSLGHNVIASDHPEKILDQPFDLIICSHNYIFNLIKHHPAPKICIAQGIIKEELLLPGANIYYAVSEEVAMVNYNNHGIKSIVLPQPIEPRQIEPVNKSLENILIVRRYEMKHDPFAELSKHYTVTISDQTKPIIDQMKQADLCISLGRGALEAMSLGRLVLVADNREYLGAIGDGYVSPENIYEITRHNFSGRRYRTPITPEWLLSELNKYNATHSQYMHKYVTNRHNALNVAKQILRDYNQYIVNR